MIWCDFTLLTAKLPDKGHMKLLWRIYWSRQACAWPRFAERAAWLLWHENINKTNEAVLYARQRPQKTDSKKNCYYGLSWDKSLCWALNGLLRRSAVLKMPCWIGRWCCKRRQANAVYDALDCLLIQHPDSWNFFMTVHDHAKKINLAERKYNSLRCGFWIRRSFQADKLYFQETLIRQKRY